MTATRKLLAIDLGAESGRGVVGHFDGSTLRLQDVHRFPNGPVATLDTLHWDVLRLHADILTAIRNEREISKVTEDKLAEILTAFTKSFA